MVCTYISWSEYVGRYHVCIVSTMERWRKRERTRKTQMILRRWSGNYLTGRRGRRRSKVESGEPKVECAGLAMVVVEEGGWLTSSWEDWAPS